ncbi:MAG: SDR family oxidoreductase [Lachnospiraceae bacterium]|nr:SDR family oxidoreductase [Lachnospiraceae bacterium]
MSDLFSLKNMNAIVTGGGKGLGKGIAEGFLENGANVIITGSSDAIFATEKEFKEKGFNNIHAVSMNLFDRENRGKAFDECIEFFGGKLDILVNNAGIQRRIPLCEFPLDAWDELIEVNLTAVFDLSQRAVNVMKKYHYGKIINVSSIGAHISSARNIPAYMAAKGGVKQLTMCFADECAEFGICTNAIAPGYAKTDLTKAVYTNEDASAMTVAKVPLGRWATPQDLKGTAVMLASHAGDYINGASIVIDGGVICR